MGNGNHSKKASLGDVIRKTDKGYVIYSEKWKRLSKPYPTREAAEKRLKEIEMFKRMKGKDSQYKGYAIEFKGDLWQVWEDKHDGDRKIAGDFPTEEEAREWIDAQIDRETHKPQLHRYDVYYVDYDTDEARIERGVLAKSASDAKKIVKERYGNKIYGYPHDAYLADKEIRNDMLEEVKRWLSKYLVEEGDPDNKLGKTHLRPLKPEEKLPYGVRHKAKTDTSGILHYKGGDYYWYIDEDGLNVERAQFADSVATRFACESYFDAKGKDLESRLDTNRFSKAKEWCLDKANKGYAPRLIDKLTGQIHAFEDPDEILLEELEEKEDAGDKLHLWIVEWNDQNGVKFSGEFDAEEDAKAFIESHKDKEHANIRISEKDVFLNDSKEEIEVELEGVPDELIEKAYKEYCECAKKEHLEYSQKLYDLLNEISKHTTTTETELLQRFKELFESEAVPVKDSASSSHIDAAEKEAKVREILKKHILKEGYSEKDAEDWISIRFKDFENEEGDKGVMCEIANDLDIDFYELPDEVVEELEKEIGWIEPYSSHLWQAIMWDKTLSDEATEPERHEVKFVTYTQFDPGYGEEIEIREDEEFFEEYDTKKEAMKAANQDLYGTYGQYVEVYVDGKFVRDYEVLMR